MLRSFRRADPSADAPVPTRSSLQQESKPRLEPAPARKASVPGALFAIVLGSVSLIGPLAVHLFLPAIPAVQRALDLSEPVAQLTFSIAVFGMAFSTLFYGRLSDSYGRRPVLLFGLCLFLAGSAGCAAAPSVLVLIAGRLVQAIGAGCGITLVRAIAHDVYGPARLVKAIAYLTMAYTLGPLISPIIGGALIDIFGWRSVFGFSLLCGTAISFGAWRLVPESRPAGVGRRSSSILQDFSSLLGNLRFNAFILQTGFCTGVFMTSATAAAALMKQVLHRPSTEFGIYFLLFPLGLLAGNFVASRIGARARNETMVAVGSLLSISAVAGQAGLLLGVSLSPVTLFVPGFFITLAQGISLSYAQAGAMAVNPKVAGTAAGLAIFAQNFVGALFAQLYGFVADGTTLPLVETTFTSAILGLIAGTIPMLGKLRTAPAKI